MSVLHVNEKNIKRNVQNHSTIEIKLGWFGMFLRLSAAVFFSMEASVDTEMYCPTGKCGCQ